MKEPTWLVLLKKIDGCAGRHGLSCANLIAVQHQARLWNWAFLWSIGISCQSSENLPDLRKPWVFFSWALFINYILISNSAAQLSLWAARNALRYRVGKAQKSTTFNYRCSWSRNLMFKLLWYVLYGATLALDLVATIDLNVADRLLYGTSDHAPLLNLQWCHLGSVTDFGYDLQGL